MTKLTTFVIIDVLKGDDPMKKKECWKVVFKGDGMPAETTRYGSHEEAVAAARRDAEEIAGSIGGRISDYGDELVVYTPGSEAARWEIYR